MSVIEALREDSSLTETSTDDFSPRDTGVTVCAHGCALACFTNRHVRCNVADVERTRRRRMSILGRWGLVAGFVSLAVCLRGGGIAAEPLPFILFLGSMAWVAAALVAKVPRATEVIWARHAKRLLLWAV